MNKGRIGDDLTTEELERLVAAYVRHTVHRRDEDFWAWERVTEVVREQDAPAEFELVRVLVRNVPDEHLGYVGAGPVEDLVQRHGEELADWIIGEAGRDPRFREALARVWVVAEELPPGLLDRLQAVTDDRIFISTSADLAEVESELEKRRAERRARTGREGEP